MNEQQLNAVKQVFKDLKWVDNWIGSKPMPDCVTRLRKAITALRAIINQEEAQPAVPQKPLFAEIITQHPGLAEELKAQSEGFDLGFKAGLAAAQPAYDQTALELCDVCGWKTLIPDDVCLNCEYEKNAAQPAPEEDLVDLAVKADNWGQP
jgi:hypothetical protein